MPITSLAERMPWHAYTHEGDGSACTLVDAETRVSVLVRLSDRKLTLGQLLEAERALAPECKSFQVVDCQTSLAVDVDEEISARCLWFELVEVSLPGVASASVPESAGEVPAISPNNSLDFRCCWRFPKGQSWFQWIAQWNLFLFGDGLVDPLMNLKDNQLVGVLPPKIDTLRGLVALLGSQFSVEARIAVLSNQNGVWADDEISWHVNRMLVEAGRKDWAFLPPVLATEGLKRNCVHLILQWIETLPAKPTVLLGAVPCNGHWIPFMWTWTDSRVTHLSFLGCGR